MRHVPHNQVVLTAAAICPQALHSTPFRSTATPLQSNPTPTQATSVQLRLHPANFVSIHFNSPSTQPCPASTQSTPTQPIALLRQPRLKQAPTSTPTLLILCNKEYTEYWGNVLSSLQSQTKTSNGILMRGTGVRSKTAQVDRKRPSNRFAAFGLVLSLEVNLTECLTKRSCILQ